MAKQNLGSPAKYKMEDRMLFIGLPSMLLAGFAIWLQHLYGNNPTGAAGGNLRTLRQRALFSNNRYFLAVFRGREG
jgi:hypothetical protein